MYQKNIVPVLFTFLLVFGVMLLSSCESQQVKEAKKAKKIAEEVKEKIEYLEMFYRHDAALLALKYKVDEEKVFNIIVDEYDLLYKNDEESVALLDDAKKLKERIEKYSDKYEILPDVIASILVDYETMQKNE